MNIVLYNVTYYYASIHIFIIQMLLLSYRTNDLDARNLHFTIFKWTWNIHTACPVFPPHTAQLFRERGHYIRGFPASRHMHSYIFHENMYICIRVIILHNVFRSRHNNVVVLYTLSLFASVLQPRRHILYTTLYTLASFGVTTRKCMPYRQRK